MIARARQIRQELTFPEQLLWKRLRDGRCLGLKFRRQHPVGPYVVDYFCPSARVVIELDGRSHEGRGPEDHKRQRYLVRQGLTVLRFTNNQVLADLKGVVKSIATLCGADRARVPPLPLDGGGQGEGNPSPLTGEGRVRVPTPPP